MRHHAERSSTRSDHRSTPQNSGNGVSTKVSYPWHALRHHHRDATCASIDSPSAATVAVAMTGQRGASTRRPTNHPSGKGSDSHQASARFPSGPSPKPQLAPSKNSTSLGRDSKPTLFPALSRVFVFARQRTSRRGSRHRKLAPSRCVSKHRRNFAAAPPLIHQTVIRGNTHEIQSRTAAPSACRVDAVGADNHVGVRRAAAA